MNLIQNIIYTHTVFGVLGQLCFVALALLILRCGRTGRRLSAYVCFLTSLPAVLGAAAAYVRLQEARSVMKIAEPNMFDPEVTVRTIFGLIERGIVNSAILLALCVLILAWKKRTPAGAFCEIQAAAE
jgi:hypothetical protein